MTRFLNAGTTGFCVFAALIPPHTSVADHYFNAFMWGLAVTNVLFALMPKE